MEETQDQQYDINSFPSITLKIRNSVPVIEMNVSDKEEKRLEGSEKGIDTFLLEVADRLDLDSTNLSDLIRTGDETYLEFGIENYTTHKLDFEYLNSKIDAEVETFSVIAEASPAVVDEMTKNWQCDILASVLEEIYNLLIARTIFLASEMGIGAIKLDDERQEARLREKMSKELAQIDLDLIISGETNGEEAF